MHPLLSAGGLSPFLCWGFMPSSLLGVSFFKYFCCTYLCCIIIFYAGGLGFVVLLMCVQAQ